MFFLDNFENTNKIFVQNIVMTKLRFEKFIVFVVAFFDITIILLKSDQITHARFKIYLDSNFQNLCDIDKNIDRVEFIKQTKFICWNESFMQRKWDMLIVNRIIIDLLNVFENFLFDDKMICFYENFKQTFLVCLDKRKDVIVDTCLQKISFWSKIKILRLICQEAKTNKFKVLILIKIKEIVIVQNKSRSKKEENYKKVLIIK